MGVEFAFDESKLGPLGPAEHHPPVPPGESPIQPEHLEIQLKAGDEAVSPTLFVFPVEQYKRLSHEAAEDIDHLRNLLTERPHEVERDMPLLPMYYAVESYHSTPKYIDFHNGSGISFLARVDHDHSLTTDESIFYTFQGLTDDDRFYISTIVPITDGVTEGVEQTETSPPADGSPERQAKAANNHGNWISVDLGDGRSLIDDMMFSLRVAPDDSFPAIKLPDLLAAPGLIAAYDETVSGSASFERRPVLVSDPTGNMEFLEGVPDLLTARFRLSESAIPVAGLEIQPVRDKEGAIFQAIPGWQQALVVDLESKQVTGEVLQTAGGQISEVQPTAFQNGFGVRGVLSGAGTAETEAPQADTFHYVFRGITGDGRYLVHLWHALPETTAAPALLNYLDGMVHSLTISSDASTESSLPVNSADCEDDAEFVEDVSIPDYTKVERGETFVKIWRVRNSGTCTWTPRYDVMYAQGNPTEWESMAITEIVPPGQETEVGITIRSPEYPGIYQAWWQIADEKQEQFGDMLALLFEAPPPATDIPGYGVIEGEINYPANGNPAFEIYFQRTDGSERYVMQTEPGWTNYSKPVPVGSYFVFARVLGDTSDSGGGYTAAVICGLHANCDDHTLVEVLVEESRANRDINVFDWYAPAGSFPLPEPVALPEPEPAAPADG